jgi:hypothetical protein
MSQLRQPEFFVFARFVRKRTFLAVRMRNRSGTCCKRKIPRACANEKITDRETMAWQKAETRVAKEKEKAWR